MYAAGHPVLPSFDLASFSEQMPKHWQYLKDKLREQPDEKLRQLLKGYYLIPERKGTLQPSEEKARIDFEQTRLVVLGSLCVLRDYARALKATTDSADKSQAPVLDYSQYDCYACHHDLKTESWRQKRGTIGRPPMREWPMVLVRVSLPHLGENQADFDLKLRTLRSAFLERPFGNPTAIGAAAGAVDCWCTKALARISTKRIDRAVAVALLRGLCAVPEVPDYDSARQIGWAIETIYGEVSSDRKAPQHEKIVQMNKELADLLKLSLPAGASRKIECELSDSLKHAYAYEPKSFKTLLDQLLKELPLE
jgi:hypothetical protein